MASVAFPENDFTKMIEAVSRRNAASGGGPGLPPTGEPQPTVRSADLGRIVEQNTAPEGALSPQELFELNQAAIAAGIKDERLGNVNAGPTAGSGDASQDVYANMTMEEVVAAGASVRMPAPPSAGPMVTRQDRTGSVRGVQPPHPQVVQPPRLPDFRNVQGIDLITGVVFVDDMEFKMHPQHLAELRKYAVETARDEIMKRLEEAVGLFTQETPAEEGSDIEGTEDEAAGVQRVSEGDSAQPTG